MSSQGSSSPEVVSLVSELTEATEADRIYEESTYIAKITLPSGKTIHRCSFCSKTWDYIVSTAKKGHLATSELAKLYSTTVCPSVPKNVSLHYTGMLTALQQKKAVKAASQVTLANRLSFQKEEIVGVKRYRQQRFDEAIDYLVLADSD